jgi:hypothetical protein
VDAGFFVFETMQNFALRKNFLQKNMPRIAIEPAEPGNIHKINPDFA